MSDNAFLYGDDLVEALRAYGFQVVHETKKVKQLQKGNLTVYVKWKDDGDVEQQPFVIHPVYMEYAHTFRSRFGADVDVPAKPYKNSNMTEFPKFRNPSFKVPTSFGLALGVSARMLPRLIEALEDKSVIKIEGEAVRVAGSSVTPVTTVERLSAARVGQGEFRASLIAIWGGSCPISHVDAVELLRASHIKPWADSTDNERLDPYNGLLLCAHVDVLFDRGWISFSNDGSILISDALSGANMKRLGINRGMALSGLIAEHEQYLDYHRDKVFLG